MNWGLGIGGGLLAAVLGAGPAEAAQIGTQAWLVFSVLNLTREVAALKRGKGNR